MHLLSLASFALLAAATSGAPTIVDDTHRGASAMSARSDGLHGGKEVFHPKILILRHGEKDRDGSIGLNAKGKKRAKCLRSYLGVKGKHNVGLILAEDYNHETLSRIRPYLTVKPLADDLGLVVDHGCDVLDAKCVRRKVDAYVKAGGRGDVVICWKHSMLHVIAHELGAPKTEPYPDDRYDIVWTMRHHKLVRKESEACPGLDRPLKKGRKDPDLELPLWAEELELDEVDAEDDVDEEVGRNEWSSTFPSSQLRLAELD